MYYVCIVYVILNTLTKNCSAEVHIHGRFECATTPSVYTTKSRIPYWKDVLKFGHERVSWAKRLKMF